MIVLITIGLTVLNLLPSSVAKAPHDGIKLVIDHDGGADDVLAISMILLYEKYFNGPNVVALTVSYGNANHSQAIINSARILNLCGRSDIPIYAGANKALIRGIKTDDYFGHDGLGDLGNYRPKPVKIQNVHAAVGLIEMSKKYEGKLVIMTIGPLTNIALAIRLDPDFLDRLSQIYVGAGYIYSKAHSTPEFNAAKDPEAYFIIADSAKVDKVTFIAFSQVYESLSITKKWRQNVLGAIDTPIVKALNGFERISIQKEKRWVSFDPVVAAIFLNPSVASEFKNTRNGIILCGPERAINTNNFSSPEPNARIFYRGDVKAYKKLLIDIYSAELQDKRQ